MTVYIAFYKGKPRADASLRDKMKYAADGLIRVITRSPYSHCELAIPDKTREGVYFCVSASIRDGGVRGKYMYLPADRWDLCQTDAYAQDVERALLVYGGAKYDWLGVFAFIFPCLRQSKKRWFCSEFCAHLLEFKNPYRYTPQSLYQKLRSHK